MTSVLSIPEIVIHGGASPSRQIKEQAQRELLEWRAGTIEARILTAEQAEAASH